MSRRSFDDVVQRTSVADPELLLVEVLLLLALLVAPDLDSRAAVDLRTSEFDQFATQLGRFPCREHHTGIRHREPQNGDEPLEVLVAHHVARIQGTIAGVLDSREGEGVRADMIPFFQVNGVREEPHRLEPPVIEPEQRAEADVVAPALHGTVLAVQSPEKVGLVARRVHDLVGRPMIGLLEDLIGADADGLHLAIAFDIQWAQLTLIRRMPPCSDLTA